MDKPYIVFVLLLGVYECVISEKKKCPQGLARLVSMDGGIPGAVPPGPGEAVELRRKHHHRSTSFPLPKALELAPKQIHTSQI